MAAAELNVSIKAEFAWDSAAKSPEEQARRDAANSIAAEMAERAEIITKLIILELIDSGVR